MDILKHAQDIHNQLKKGAAKNVLWVILKHHPNKVSRINLLAEALDHYTTNPANSSADRRMRQAIRELQNLGVPIVSDSHSGGYWLATGNDLQRYLYELDSRIAKLSKKRSLLARLLPRKNQVEMFND